MRLLETINSMLSTFELYHGRVEIQAIDIVLSVQVITVMKYLLTPGSPQTSTGPPGLLSSFPTLCVVSICSGHYPSVSIVQYFYTLDRSANSISRLVYYQFFQ